MPASSERHAVVLGGGIAGLLATRVLTDRFDRVTLVEKGALANGLDPRRNAPQGAHVHGLLERGRQVLDSLFPGITDELIQGGATLVGIDGVRIFVLGWRKAHHGTDRILSMTRPFLETTISRRVRALNKVTVIEDAEAIGVSGSAERVTGIVLREASGTESSVATDFIVDARGRISNLSDWMKALGATPPPFETSPLSSVYCSVLTEPKPGEKRPLLHQVANFEERMGVLLFPVEGGRVQISVGANTQRAMPKTYGELLELLRTLPVPDAYDAARRLQPVTPLAYSRFTASVRRNYDTLRSPPEGIVALGDAVASFNPIFGQGMTIAALEADWLSNCFAKHDPSANGFAKAYYAGVKPIIDLAWGLPDLEAKRANPRAQNAVTRFLLWYTERLQRAASRNEYVSQRMMRVQNMLEPPAALFSPSMVARVLFA